MIRKLVAALAIFLVVSGVNLVDVVAQEGHSTPQVLPITDPNLPTLRAAILPVLNTLPFYVAQREGYFVEEGVNIEFVQVVSARDRDTVFIAGEADILNLDLVGTILLVNAGFDIRAVRLDPPADHFFSIVAAPSSNIETVEDLKGVAIGWSSNTGIEYSVVTLLRNAGLQDSEIVGVDILDIRQRLTLLLAGEIQAASLPEPLSTIAIGAGGRVIVDDSDSDFIGTVIGVSLATLENQPDAVRAFMRGYERAVEAINANPEKYREVLVTDTLFPEDQELRENYPVPHFLSATIPSVRQVQSVMNWMVERGIIDETLEYEDIVNGSFLPETEDHE